MLNDYQEYNPLRSACWRLERVRELIDAHPRPRPPSRKNDDAYVRTYYNFLLKIRSADSDDWRATLSTKQPALFQAHCGYWSLDLKQRAILEAHILTGETDAQIAQRTGMLPKAVECFEALFFNVRDRLSAQIWIVKTIRGTIWQPAVTANGVLTPQQRWIAYKLFAYFGGPHILDAMIRILSPSASSTSPPIAEWFDTATVSQIRQLAVLAVSQGDMLNPIEWLRAYTKLTKQQQRAKTTGSGVLIEQNIEEFLKEVDRLRTFCAPQESVRRRGGETSSGSATP
jgi:hypothetical protein